MPKSMVEAARRCRRRDVACDMRNIHRSVLSFEANRKIFFFSSSQPRRFSKPRSFLRGLTLEKSEGLLISGANVFLDDLYRILEGHCSAQRRPTGICWRARNVVTIDGNTCYGLRKPSSSLGSSQKFMVIPASTSFLLDNVRDRD